MSLTLFFVYQHDVTGSHREETEYVHRILALLPSLTCRSPQQSLDALTQGETECEIWTKVMIAVVGIMLQRNTDNKDIM